MFASGTCTVGKKQSPVNIPLAEYLEDVDTSSLSQHGPIEFVYNNQTGATVLNPGHGTMQVSQFCSPPAEPV